MRIWSSADIRMTSGRPACIKPRLDLADFVPPLPFTEVKNVYSCNAPQLRGQLR